jgi:hypothetical protein
MPLNEYSFLSGKKMPLDTCQQELLFPVGESQPLISLCVCLGLVFVVCAAQMILCIVSKQSSF